MTDDLNRIEEEAEDRAKARYLIEKTCLPICMVDDAGNWVRPVLVGNTGSGRPVYRAMEGRRAAFLGYDWEPLQVECRVEDDGAGLFTIVP